jgi:hypothetical protein
MNDWTTLARALRQLHHALLQRARADYTREHGLAEELPPGELLMLLTQDPAFAWLRSLSELMADIDDFQEQAAAVPDQDLRAAIRAAVDSLLTPPADGAPATPFGQHYRQHLHDEPAVTMAHAAVKQALQAWPAKAAGPVAALAEHRRRIERKPR